MPSKSHYKHLLFYYKIIHFSTQYFEFIFLPIINTNKYDWNTVNTGYGYGGYGTITIYSNLKKISKHWK